MGTEPQRDGFPVLMKPLTQIQGERGCSGGSSFLFWFPARLAEAVKELWGGVHTYLSPLEPESPVYIEKTPDPEVVL